MTTPPRLLPIVAMILSLLSGNSGEACDEKANPDVSELQLQDGRIEALNKDVSDSLEKELSTLGVIKDDAKNAVDLYSRRGDLRLFLGQFAEAESDYKQMVRLRPDVDKSHWRLGIAMYLADRPQQAAAQFDKYHSFDNVDRENGIWRYLSHRAAFGKEKAREQLLKYEKDDRPPFREVYQMFEGTLTKEELLQSIPSELPNTDRNSRLFYAHLYIGLHLSADGDKTAAKESLREAVLNDWPRNAGFGPNYMWHVGRLQYQRCKASE